MSSRSLGKCWIGGWGIGEGDGSYRVIGRESFEKVLCLSWSVVFGSSGRSLR